MATKKETMDLLKEMDRKSVAMTVSKLKWSTEPSGGDLKHALNITVNMTTEDRGEVESLVREYWELKCTLAGTLRPVQSSFDTETFGGDEDGMELAD